MIKSTMNRLTALEDKSEDAKFLQAVEYIETWMFEHIRAFNTPEAVAQRKADYEKVQQIGRLRREAFYRGEPMSNYPLPWETISKVERREK